MRSAAVFATLALFLGANAADHSVSVANEANELKFFPETLSNIPEGDTVTFMFAAGSHSVTESTFSAPCTLKEGGVDSGIMPATPGQATVPTWSFTVKNGTAPAWFYCKAGRHCAAGMVFSINPTAERSHETFKATAQGAPAPASGGNNTTTTPNGATLNGKSVGAVALAALGVASQLL